MRIIGVALGLALLAGSCTKDVGKGESPSVDSLPAVSYIDLSYGEDAKQKVDLYLPENRNSNTPLLIIIHGGGWSGGDKSDFNSYITEFQNRLPGYAFANLNYRLVKQSGNYFPTQENDVNAAIQFLKGNAASYNISSDFVYLGISAGAHLALLQGYKHSDVLQPRAIVSFFGPTDLQRMYSESDTTLPSVLRIVLDATIKTNPNIFYQSSPVNFVTSQSAPTLLLHGDNDQLVPISQAYELRDKLNEAGVYNNLIVYPGQSHGWTGADLDDSFQKVVDFVKGLEN